MDRRVHPSGETRATRDPGRSALRLPDERCLISGVAGVVARTPAADFGGLGTERSLVHCPRAIAQFFGGDEAKLQDYLKFRDGLTGLKNPTRISDVIASGLDRRCFRPR